MSYLEKIQEELYKYRRELTLAYNNEDEFEKMRINNIIQRRLKQIYKYNIEQINEENKKNKIKYYYNLILNKYKKRNV